MRTGDIGGHPFVDPEALLRGLNPQQREAVLANERSVLVFAGAGSGKTRVLTHRIAYLIATGRARPQEILAVTFTNKAADEMKDRLEGLLGPEARGLWVGTFHAVCARILRTHISHLGRSGDFVIYDEEDQLRVVTELLRSMGIDPKAYPPSRILKEIERAKNRAIGPEEYQPDPFNPFQQRTAAIYPAYQEALKEANALDYGDLLLIAHRVLQIPEVRDRYHERFRHILVDEYQDTNYVQYLLLKDLTGPHTSVFVVGDDDQSIYAWRGAEPANIYQFERDFPEVRVVKLEQNYRCTKRILEGANAVVERNRQRTPKRLWTENPVGEPIHLYVAENELDEALWVADRIRESGRPLGHFAVFYRIGAQSRAVEEALIRYGIPYTLVGGVRFYQRREVKDLIAYLRLVQNPRDEVSLRRILNVPPRGLGKRGMEKLEAIKAEGKTSLWDALKAALHKGVLRRTEGLQSLVGLLEELHAVREELSPAEIATRIIDATGYIQYLEGLEGGTDRVENVAEFIEALREQEGGLAEVLGALSLLGDVDEYRPGDHVTLMTLHSAKGLEFPVVFIVGLEEGLLPHHLRLQDPRELEEERRLFYVGMTRAKEELFLSYAERRGLFGRATPRMPSRFLGELPQEILIVEGDGRPCWPEGWVWEGREW